MNENPIQVSAVQLVGSGIAPPTQLLPSSPRRVWLIVANISGVAVLLATGQAADLSQVFYTLNAGSSQRFLRKEYGPLVTGEVWITDGSGNTPASNVSVIEGQE